MKLKFISCLLLCTSLSSFAQNKTNWFPEDELSLDSQNKDLVSSTEKLFKQKKLKGGKFYELVPSEVFVSLIGGFSENLTTNIHVSDNKTPSNLYTTSDYTPNGGFVWGGGVGCRRDRHSIEANVLFAKINTPPLVDDDAYYFFSGEDITINVSNIIFSASSLELALKYKYFIYANAWFELQVGGFAGGVFSPTPTYYKSSASSTSFPSSNMLFAFSFDAKGNSLSAYNTFSVGGLIDARCRLSERLSLGLEFDLQYNLRPFEASLQYNIYREGFLNGNKTIYTKSVNADLSGHFLLLRPLLKLSYHIPIKPRKPLPL